MAITSRSERPHESDAMILMGRNETSQEKAWWLGFYFGSLVTLLLVGVFAIFVLEALV